MEQTIRDWLGRDYGSIALVFTDIVDSTAIALSMPEREWIEILKRHFERARFHWKSLHGFEVKLIGDACMVAFHTPAEALQFATDFYHDTGSDLIAIKVGIHFGSVQVVENDIYGLMVNYTSRIQHLLQHSGIAFSRAVRDDIQVLGPDLANLGRVVALTHNGIKSFGPEYQEVYQLVWPELRLRRREEQRAKLERAETAARRHRAIRQIPPQPSASTEEKLRPTLNLGIKPRNKG